MKEISSTGVIQMDVIAVIEAPGKKLTVRRRGADVVQIKLTQTALNQKDKYSAQALVSLSKLMQAYDYARMGAYQRTLNFSLQDARQIIYGTTICLQTTESDRRMDRIMLMIVNAGQGSVTRTFMSFEQSDLLALISKIYVALKVQRPPTTN